MSGVVWVIPEVLEEGAQVVEKVAPATIIKVDDLGGVPVKQAVPQDEIGMDDGKLLCCLAKCLKHCKNSFVEFPNKRIIFRCEKLLQGSRLKRRCIGQECIGIPTGQVESSGRGEALGVEMQLAERRSKPVDGSPAKPRSWTTYPSRQPR